MPSSARARPTLCLFIFIVGCGSKAGGAGTPTAADLPGPRDALSFDDAAPSPGDARARADAAPGGDRADGGAVGDAASAEDAPPEEDDAGARSEGDGGFAAPRPAGMTFEGVGPLPPGVRRNGGTTPVKLKAWIPNGVAVLRGGFLHTNEDMSGSAFFQRLGAELGFAVLGGNVNGGIQAEDRLAVGQSFGAALEDLAAKSGHPEVARLPLFVSGFSGGAGIAKWFADQRPEQVIGASLYGNGTLPGKDSGEVPWTLSAGDHDPNMFVQKEMKNLGPLRTAGAHVALAMMWGGVHQEGTALSLVAVTWREAARLRLPATPVATGPTPLTALPLGVGWLGDPASWESSFATIAPAATYAGDPNQAVWLMSGYHAQAWRAFVSKGSPVQIASPPAVQNARVALLPAGRVPVEIRIDEGTSIARVALYDGDRMLAESTTPPFLLQPVLARGVYALNAVGVEPGGAKHSSRLHVIEVR